MSNGALNKVTLVVFSFDRALQLDLVLRSYTEYFKNLQLPIHVIYHCSESHKNSYDLLMRYWEKRGVEFHLRKKMYSRIKLLKLLLRPLNMYWYIRSQWMRRSFDNFKFLLETTIKNCNSNYITLSTDDQVMFKTTIIPETVFDSIKSDKNKYSYRFITSIDFEDEFKIPNGLDLKIIEENGIPYYFQWDNKNGFRSTLWKYRFHVDGTVYDKNALLSLLSPVLYHMPTTLEGSALWESRFRRYFRTGLSSVDRTVIGIQANNIQSVVDTPSASFEIDVLRLAYEDGYRLNFDISAINKKKYIYVPKDLHFTHSETQRIVSYSEYKSEKLTSG